jgi:hypothetical protein
MYQNLDPITAPSFDTAHLALQAFIDMPALTDECVNDSELFQDADLALKATTLKKLRRIKQTAKNMTASQLSEFLFSIYDGSLIEPAECIGRAALADLRS